MGPHRDGPQEGVAAKQRSVYIKRASWAGIIGNAGLAVLKIGTGLLSGSLALVGAGLDTVTDVVTSIITLFTAGITEKPPDREHPYGHTRAETIATKTLSFIIFFAGAQLALTTLRNLFGHEVRSLPGLAALVVTGVSVLGKVGLYGYKQRMGKLAESSMLLADARNMLADVFLSLGVLAGLLFTYLFHLPIADPIIALLVSGWIIKNGLEIFFETNAELMDGTADQDLYRQVFDAALDIDGVSNPHRTRIRKLNTLYVIDMDIEVDGGLSVKKGHALAQLVEDRIREHVPRVYDVMVHVEPGGNVEKSERYGLSEESLD